MSRGRERMRVLFDAFWWDEGPIANRAVQRDIIDAWATRHPDDELVLAVRRNARADGIPDGARIVRTSLWPHALANRLQLGRLARRSGAEVIVAHNFTPIHGNALVFIHDVMFLVHPEWFSYPERAYFRPMLRWARSANAIATSTHTEAERIRRLDPGIPAPIATGLGVPSSLVRATPRRPAGLSEVAGFAITVGRLNARKNLERILEAVSVSHLIDRTHPLIVVGGTGHSGVPTQFAADVHRSIEDGRIVMLGRASDDELAWLYTHTSLTITLSLDEGFGLPAIEAAHFGAPLLASDIPVFRETVGEYARFVEPDADPRTIADAIAQGWEHAPSASARRAIADEYTWDRAVEFLRDATH